MKKILVITNMYPGRISKTFGIFVKNQVEALRSHGTDVDVAAVDDPRMGKPNVLKKYTKWMLQTMRQLVSKGKQYDVVHAHYVFPSGFLALAFKKLFGTKLVVTAHGGDIDKMPHKNAFIFNQTKNILQNADHIIAVGEALKEEIVQTFGADEQRVTIMSMGVNRDVFTPTNQQAAKQRLGLDPNKKSLLYVGNIIEAKGLRELLQAYSSIKAKDADTALHFVGSPKKEAFLQELKQTIEEQTIEDVYFLGPKPQQEVALWMSAADVFVLPSYIEGFGLVAVEAMSCNTPVVGTDVGGLSYLLRNDHGVLVEPKNEASLQEGIERVLYNKELQHTLTTNGEKQAQDNDQEVLTKRLQEIYEKIGEN
ncbi:glycosyltransferase [Pontibacillus salicampi]|uniref:Glycosyltransferase n=1 Tax=Pontibacillus salicampi TaxID=1449801 RepID=A0ABV6LSA2_9BACI